MSSGGRPGGSLFVGDRRHLIEVTYKRNTLSCPAPQDLPSWRGRAHEAGSAPDPNRPCRSSPTFSGPPTWRRGATTCTTTPRTSTARTRTAKGKTIPRHSTRASRKEKVPVHLSKSHLRVDQTRDVGCSSWWWRRFCCLFAPFVRVNVRENAQTICKSRDSLQVITHSGESKAGKDILERNNFFYAFLLIFFVCKKTKKKNGS